jgi:hypothetical protein
MSAGVGAAFAAIPNLILVAVDERETGEATGTNTVMRNVGAAVGAQLAASLLAAHILANGSPADAGFTLAFLVGAGGAGVAALSLLLIPGRGSRTAAELRAEPAAS